MGVHSVAGWNLSADRLRQLRLATAAVLVSTLTAALFLVAGPPWAQLHKHVYTAYFTNTNGLYTGDEIRILGVAVGTVDRIEPLPDAARVTFSVGAQYRIPADARAAILSPSLVSARAIQLVPAYSGGPELANGASIGLERTAVPVEWDDFREQLEKLTDSLQPADTTGRSAVGEFVTTAAANLRGQGDTARETVIKLSQAMSALGDHSTDIFSTVRNMQLLVSALTSSSDLLAAFNVNLADITTVLSSSTREFADAMTSLDSAVTDLRGFIGENREGFGVTVDHLAAITTALNESRGDLKQVLHIAPSVFQNFVNIYQPAQSAITGVMALGNFANTVQFICGGIEALARANSLQASKLCVQYLAPIIKNRQYNFLPIGGNPFVGTAARPNEITYSEDRLRPAAAQQPPEPAPQPVDPELGLPGLLLPAPPPEDNP
jgi:phospholipid/cholesterol/gamma-HCH transport system substrate-binding protein